MAETALTKITLDILPHIAEGKVRDLYEIDSKTLLFVALDRISAYEGILSKGILLNLLSAHWFYVLSTLTPILRTLPHPHPSPLSPSSQRSLLENRLIQVRRLKIFPIEAIVRGIPILAGLQNSQAFPQGAIYTPSTKAEAGHNNENISVTRAVEIVGPQYAKRIKDLVLSLYTAARDYVYEREIIIADTKLEFGLDKETDEIVLVDEVLIPDSSRFWPGDTYEIGHEQSSYDREYLRQWLVKEALKGKEGVRMPEEVVKETVSKYKEAFELLTRRKWSEAVKRARGCRCMYGTYMYKA